MSNYEFIDKLSEKERTEILNYFDDAREELQKYAPPKGTDYDEKGNLIVFEETVVPPKSSAAEWNRRRGSVLFTDKNKTYGFPHGHIAIVSDTHKKS